MVTPLLADLDPITKRELIASTCQASLYEYMREAWAAVESSPFVDNWHIGAICEHLQAVTEGQITELLINVPPGCSKSLTTCVMWPTWEWIRNPSIRWFFSCYDQQLSTRDSVRCRTLLNSDWYQSLWGGRFHLIDDQNQKTYYETNCGGYRMATSVGGHGTGEHPDRIVVDDPHNVKRAESDVERKSVLDWWDLTMSTRGVSRGVRRVVIMQRLHHGDMSAHLLSKGSWVHLCLPMRYESGRMVSTPLGWNDPRQKDGELLAPEQFDEVKVAEQEKNLGRYGAAGQLQQRPTPREGGMFREAWFSKVVRSSPYHARRVLYVDRAFTVGDTSCNTAATVISEYEGNWYVGPVWVGRWEPDERDSVIISAAQQCRHRWGPNHEPTIVIEQEPAAGIDSYRALAKKLAGFSVKADPVRGNKEQRADPWASQCAAGNVYLVDDNGSWDIPEWIKEHCSFPLGSLKDRVDSACLVAGTLVTTAGGCKPIEEVTERDAVLTRNGYRRVLWAGQSGMVSRLVSVLFCDGTVLTGTYNHLVWILGKGYTTLASLTVNDKAGGLCPSNQRGSRSFISEEFRTTYDRTMDIIGGKEELNHCTGQFGSIIMAKSPVAIKYITRTGTSETIALKILNVSRLRNMLLVIPSEMDGKDKKSIWKELVSWLQSGMLQKQDVSGIEEPALGRWQSEFLGSLFVRGARNRLNQSCMERMEPAAFALQDVLIDVDKRREDVNDMRRSARHAESRLWASGKLLSFVQKDVHLGGGGTNGLVPVYDLTVDRDHEFYANGILVHNSGGFNWLANRTGRRTAAQFKILPIKPADSKEPLLRLVVCSRKELDQVIVEEPSLLINFADPEFTNGEVMCNGTDYSGTSERTTSVGGHVIEVVGGEIVASSVRGEATAPAHGLSRLLGKATLEFADMDPAEYQDRWEQPLPDFGGKSPSQLRMLPEHGKRIWKQILQNRDPAWQICVFCDSGDRRALSAAYAVADTLRLDRAKYIYQVADPEGLHKQEPPNRHVYSVVQATRMMVI